MSRRQFKSQASSNKAAFGAFGSPSSGFGRFGSPSGFGSTTSTLSYIAEPPDLSGVSDPNVVIIFKNLSKKDSTTKSKALEDLQSFVGSPGEKVGLEDAVLEAWIKLYPRTSIDNSRRVRQLAHLLQGQIAAKCGKRIAKQLPNVVGAWLGGLYDNDRTVARAAQDSFKQVFATAEKMRNVWKAFARSILDYSESAILHETVQTLSDERTVTPEDAEAKYARVVACSLSVINTLLSELDFNGIEKCSQTIDELLANVNIWNFADHSDAAVRRAIYRLLRTALANRRETISSHLKALSGPLIAKGLVTSQLGSAYDYVETLSTLTEMFPQVWTTFYVGKKPPIGRMRQFLKKGSQGGPAEVWLNVLKLFQSLPSDLLPQDVEGAVEILNDLRSGVSNKDEPKTNNIAAWSCYVAVAFEIAKAMTLAEDQRRLILETVCPILENYLKPNPETQDWPYSPQSLKICSLVLRKASAMNSQNAFAAVCEQWHACSSHLVEDMKTSLPEQAKYFDKSQVAVAEEGKRWFLLQAEVLRDNHSDPVRSLIGNSSSHLITEAMQLLKSRRGKPYGAAALIDYALSLISDVLLEDQELIKKLSSFIRYDLPDLILSPSSPYLFSIMSAFSGTMDLSDVWINSLHFILESPESNQKTVALRGMLTRSKSGVHAAAVRGDVKLEEYLLDNFAQAMSGTDDRWSMISDALESSVISAQGVDNILSQLSRGLTLNGSFPHALNGLEKLVKKNETAMQTFLSTKEGSELLARVISLTESSDDDIARRAEKLNATIEISLSKHGNGGNITQSVLQILKSGITTANSESLLVESLIELALKLFQQTKEENRPTIASQLLPDADEWTKVLMPFLSLIPRSSLAITSPLRGAVFTVVGNTNPGLEQSDSRDPIGLSAAMRTGWYTIKLVESVKIFDCLGEDKRSELYYNLTLLTMLMNENLGLSGANDLWSSYTPLTETDISELLSTSQRLMTEWLIDSDPISESSIIQLCRHKLVEGSKGSTSSAYYHSLGLTKLDSELLDGYGYSPPDLGDMQEALKNMRRSKDILFATAELSSFSVLIDYKKAAVRLCNELIADLTGLDTEKRHDEGLNQLVLLNSILEGQESVADDVPQQRLMFLVKHLVTWLNNHVDVSTLASEVLKVLTTVLPLVKGVYGSHWAEVLAYINNVWTALSANIDEDDLLPAAHSALRLFVALKVAKADSNDDLEDAWEENLPGLSRGLLSLLGALLARSDGNNQPLRVFNELLARQVSNIDSDHIESIEGLFPILYAESSSIQQAAFDTLHSQIPATQEQISFDAALSNKDAHLPEELMSLLLETPRAGVFDETSFDRSIPLSLRGYLYSWLLIFDHFTHSSYKVKSDYIADLKQAGVVADFLDFAFDFLGHARGKPVDASKFNVTIYEPDTGDTPLKETQWLLVHLYYLALKHVPSLARTWWFECKHRTTVQMVEPWTERYISPHVIDDELSTVNGWVESEGTGEEKLQIKVNKKAKEVWAGYEVDEQTMQIMIRLPGVYPLHQAVVDGINRVGVDEKKWKSWLINTQGVITFSNGSIIDGLTAWRRNVTGALKGQTECAICYSIISADRQLPNKRCNTCKNLFHGQCLYKWFSSSNSSSCPLCRNSFNYG